MREERYKSCEPGHCHPITGSMTRHLILQERSRPRSLLADEDVLGDIVAWHEKGLRTALVTLVAIDGTTPRPLGAQMAVAEDQRYSGYLSGGCIEPAIALEACQAITSGQNRLVRYGKGSAYLDVQLPCGSGLDLYFDQGLTAELVAGIAQRRSERQPFTLVTDIVRGQCDVLDKIHDPASTLDGDVFYRTHLPSLRVLLVGGGPALFAIAVLFHAVGVPMDVFTPDEQARADLFARGIDVRGLTDAREVAGHGDRWTAAIVAFHEHVWEAQVLARVLDQPH